MTRRFPAYLKKVLWIALSLSLTSVWAANGPDGAPLDDAVFQLIQDLIELDGDAIIGRALAERSPRQDRSRRYRISHFYWWSEWYRNLMVDYLLSQELPPRRRSDYSSNSDPCSDNAISQSDTLADSRDFRQRREVRITEDQIVGPNGEALPSSRTRKRRGARGAVPESKRRDRPDDDEDRSSGGRSARSSYGGHINDAGFMGSRGWGGGPPGSAY